MARRSIAGLRGVVTGASSGIGRAIARELIARDAHVVAVARSAEKLAGILPPDDGRAGNLVVVPGDVNSDATRRRAIDAAREHWGGLDFVVNNAGIGAQGPFATASPERLRAVMETNFFAAVELIRAALPALLAGRQPIVVNVGSILGHRAIPLASEYCASKFALRGFSESLRAELAPRGIDVLLVSPGTVETDFFAHALDQRAMPWGRPRGVTPEHVARGVVAAMATGRAEIVVNRRGQALLLANRLFPRLVDRLMRRYGSAGGGP